LTGFLGFFLLFAVFGMIVCLALTTYRVVAGPTAPDRVVAVDVMVNIVTAMMVLLGVYYQEPIMVDTALLLAFLSFIGTLAISKYLEGRGLGD